MPEETAQSRTISRLTLLALLAIMVSGFCLRVFDVNWDQSKNLHPDELFVSGRAVDMLHQGLPYNWDTLSDPEISPLNPRYKICDNGANYCNYSYGALPLLLVQAGAKITSEWTGEDYTGLDRLRIIGRKMSASVDTLTILLVFLLATRLFNQNVGLLSAATYAATPLQIQLSHFFTTDIWLAFFVALTIWCSILALDKERHGWFMLAGMSFGFALATKGSIILLAGIPALAAILWAWRRLDPDDPADAVLGCLSRLLLSGVAAVVGFGMFEPYALVRSSVYIAQLQEQQNMASGTIDFPYTRRYVGTTPGVYQLEQLWRWGMGPVATTLAIIGVGLMAWFCIKRRQPAILLPLAFLGLQLIVVLTPQIKFLRYQAPLIPVLSIGCGLAIWTGYKWLANRVNILPAIVFAGICLAGIGLWTAAFTNIYRGDQSRIAASKWIYANVPMGSVLTGESWDDLIPVPLGPLLTSEDNQYTVIALDIYGDRPQEDVSDYLWNQLQSADFVVQSSNRLRESVATEPWRYPVQNAYYQLLDSGQLGWTLVADFQTEPEIFGYEFDDGLADESWVNYDHPRVRIYQKTSQIDRATWDSLFADAVASPWTVSRLDPSKDSLMLDEPVGQLTATTDYRWSERWTSNSGVAVIFWIALLLIFSFVGWPWVRLLFPRAPDGGTGLARTMTLIIAGWLMWFLASLKLVIFSSVWSWVCLAATAILGWVLWWTLADRKRRFPKLVISGAEIAFWLFFALFLFYRWVNPDSWHPSWGGEKPMEFAHLNATLRSANFPPFDPWFSDGYINYYYYGLYLVAYAIKLTGIPAEIAFNLAQPTIMGMMASCAYSLAAALSAGRTRKWQATITGLCAAVLLALIGNLFEFVNVLKTWPGEIRPYFGLWFWDPSRAITGTITEFPYFTGTYADLHAHGINVPNTLVLLALLLTLARDPWLTALGASRPRNRKNLANLIVRLGVTGLLVGTVATTNSWDAAEYIAFLAVGMFMTTLYVRPFPMRLLVTAIGTGIAGFIALATFAPFYAKYVALFSTVGQTRDKTEVTQMFLHFGIFFAILGVGVTALLLNLQRGKPFAFMADPVLPMAIAGAGIAVAVATNWKLDIDDNTIKVAVVLACFVLSVPVGLTGAQHRIASIGDMAIGFALIAWLFEIALTLDGRGSLALAVAFFLLGGTLWVFAQDRSERMTGALVACAAGIVGAIEIVFLEDNLAGGDAYRMNTVFKFYNQVWVLFAVAAAVVFGRALRNGGMLNWLGEQSNVEPLDYWYEEDLPALPDPMDDPALSPSPAIDPIQTATYGLNAIPSSEPIVPEEVSLAVEPEPATEVEEPTEYEPSRIWLSRERMRINWARATVIVTMIAILLGLVYPVFATRVRLDERFPGYPSPGTLNSYDWMTYGTLPGWNNTTVTFNGDYDAIYWFINNVEGSPVIMEAAIGPYRGAGSRFSIHTGLPDVIGWDNHETQQRYVADIAPRVTDVKMFYSDGDVATKAQTLAKYRVEYVIVGDVERYSEWGDQRYASDEGLAAIESMVGTYLEVAFQSGNTTVYRVIPDSLPTVVVVDQ